MSRRIGSQSLRDERLIEWRGSRWKRERRATHLDLTTQTFFPLSLIPFSHPPYSSCLPYASPTEQEDSAEEEEQTVSLKDLILARNYTYWRKDNRSHMQCILSYSCQNLMDKNQAFFSCSKAISLRNISHYWSKLCCSN